jgi:hypothetical protein
MATTGQPTEDRRGGRVGPSAPTWSHPEAGATTALKTASPRPPGVRRRFGRTGWAVLTLLCFATAALVSPYLSFNPAVYFDEQRAVYLQREVTLGLHISGAMLALLVGPFQFLPRLRRGHARVHRTLGVIYLCAATVGGLGGLGMAPTAYTGAVASAGFAAMGVCWLACTWIGFGMIMRGRVADHRRWMIRSFAVVLGGVTLRLVLGTYSAVEGSVGSWLPFETVYVVTSWLCWVPNLLIALWITRSRPARSTGLVDAHAAQ